MYKYNKYNMLRKTPRRERAPKLIASRAVAFVLIFAQNVKHFRPFRVKMHCGAGNPGPGLEAPRDEWSAAKMSLKKMLPALLVLLLAPHGSLSAQAFGQLGGAGAAPDGEGCAFMLAGNDAFRAGLSTRFNISTVSDIGIQLGVDRVCEESFYGGGLDLKVVLLESQARLPVNLALDAALSGLSSSAAGRFIFGFGILASGVIESSPSRVIEPYLSFVVDIERINDKKMGKAVQACLCSGTGSDETHACSLVRAGVKVPVSSEAQILIEANIGDKTLVGAALNLVF